MSARLILVIIIMQRSMKMTHRWLDRCVNHLESASKVWLRSSFQLFKEVATDVDNQLNILQIQIRWKCHWWLSVGEPAEENAMTVVCEILPEDATLLNGSRNTY
jgi:queuine tRNA-ribosyltransferase